MLLTITQDGLTAIKKQKLGLTWIGKEDLFSPVSREGAKALRETGGDGN